MINCRVFSASSFSLRQRFSGFHLPVRESCGTLPSVRFSLAKSVSGIENWQPENSRFLFLAVIPQYQSCYRTALSNLDELLPDSCFAASFTDHSPGSSDVNREEGIRIQACTICNVCGKGYCSIVAFRSTVIFVERGEFGSDPQDRHIPGLHSGTDDSLFC